MHGISRAALAAIVTLAAGGAAHATIFNGTAYFTYYTNQQVADVSYSYNDVTHSFSVGSPQTVAFLPGADGLIFANGGQNILVGGQSATVYDISLATKTYTTNNVPGPGSYHLTLNGSTLYTSGPYGQSNAPLVTATVTSTGLTNVSSMAVTGADNQVTQLAFAGNQVFYTNSQPNCCGDVGTINLSTGVTTLLEGNVTAAHGIVDDPFTGLVDLFGGGWVGTIDPTTGAVNEAAINGANFDQGSPDGYGHALIAGSNGITFIDYSHSHNILAPDYVTYIGGFSNIDDIAPLAGPGSTGGGVPEPATWALMLIGAGAVGSNLRRRLPKALTLKA